MGFDASVRDVFWFGLLRALPHLNVQVGVSAKKRLHDIYSVVLVDVSRCEDEQ